MGLQTILEAIQVSERAQVREIEERAEAEAHQIIAQAEAETQRIREEARRAASSGATDERARILHRAKLEAMQIVGDAQEALVDEALNQIGQRLANLRATSAYPAVLRALTEEALEASQEFHIEEDPARLQADARDRALLDGILDDIGSKLGVTYPLATRGGVIVGSWDGRVVVDNTLEARLRLATPYLRRYLPTLLDQGR